MQMEVSWGDFISMVLPVVCALISLGWYTVLERKVLGYSGIRKGPNKVGFMGLLQPISDGVKLFTKEMVLPSYSNKCVFVLCPLFGFFVSMVMWFLYPYNSAEAFFACGVLYYLVGAGVSMYVIFASGWASNSKYALVGSVRSVAQSVSYEAVLGFLFLSLVVLAGCLDVSGIKSYSEGYFVVSGLMLVPFFFLFLVCILAESNRAPFDFVEGESELVSGFNVEYSGMGFVILFMTEYSSMLFNSVVVSSVFLGGCDFFVSAGVCLFLFSYFWARSTLPRYRCDLFMAFMWKVGLSLVVSGLLLLMVFVKILG